VYLSITEDHNQSEAPDFFEYVKSIIEQFAKSGRKGMASNYKSALNAFKEFSKVDRISINEINSKLVSEFASYLKNADSRRYRHEKVKNSGRAVSLYLSILRAVINRARAEYNDEDRDQIIVRVNPFAKFKVPKEVRPPQRALSIDKIRAIRDLELNSDMVRATMARDCFMLSFYMIGMNSVDMFDHPPVVYGRITYERKKTRTRREDKALISVKVEPEAEALLNKYNFRKLYANSGTFNSAINQGLKQVGKLIGEPDLTFYAARHSWATIAVNDCEIDKYLVHSALNHTDETMRVTDIYIKKDWSVIDRANRKVLDYLCDF
jgi:integrase